MATNTEIHKRTATPLTPKILAYSFAVSLASAFVGMLLPAGSAFGIHLSNVPWGFVYGFGWYALGFVQDIRNPLVQLFGGYIWPVGVFVAMWYLWARGLCAARYRVLMSIGLTFFLVLPESVIFRTPLQHVPVYWHILEAVY